MKQSRARVTKFNVGLVQMAPAHLDTKGNVAKMVDFIREAAAGGAKLIVFPELIGTYWPDRRPELYEPLARR